MRAADPPEDARHQFVLDEDAKSEEVPQRLPPFDDATLAAWRAETAQWWTPERAKLERDLSGLLDDGSGAIHPKLIDVWADLISMPVPGRGLLWISNNPHVAEYLRGLARGEIPLSHEALHELESWRTVAHLRDLLMAAGALPPVDRQILLFERWHHVCLRELGDDDGHARLLRQFATWYLLPNLHAKAARAPLTAGSRNSAADRFNTAHGFLVWLAGRGHRLHQTAKADIDAWYAATQPDPNRVRPFLKWAMTSGHAPRIDLPKRTTNQRSPISQHHRLALLRRFLTNDRIALRTRVAACLLLLYAQPISRLVRLTVHDVNARVASAVTLRLGNPPTPVPEPFAAMLVRLAADRANMNTATNPDCDWLFPGGRAGQPLTPGALLQQLRALGVPVTQTRTAAFRQLVLQAPAPVVAQALGYDHGTATKYVAAAGGTWNRYPAARDRTTPR